MSANNKLMYSTMIILFVCGVLIGFLGSSLYWRGEAEKEISQVLSGKHFIDSRGNLWVTPKK